jgi:oligopeptide transport system permease protein
MKMFLYILKRIGLMFMVFFIIMTICFVLVRLLPNEIPPAMGDQGYALRAMHEAWGYNKPILVQYGIFLKKVFTEFDWGVCKKVDFLTPVTKHVAAKLPATMSVNIYAVLFSLPLGILFGIFAALKKNKWQDQVISILTMVFISVPSFVYAFIVQYFFATKLSWFPHIVAALESGLTYFSPVMLKSMVLPVLALSFSIIAHFTRFTRAELTETLTSDYMLLARAKGLTRRQATVRHALRNSFVPILPMILAEFLGIIGGSLVIEKIFAIPGIGGAYIGAINNRDYDLFLYLSMFYTTIGLLSGLLIDLSYGFIDPRIRMGGGKTNEL